MYALKTAPAFCAAMMVGLRMAAPVHADRANAVRGFCRHLGVAYQILDDLADLYPDGQPGLGSDVLGRRPTILQAFVREAGAGERLNTLLRRSSEAGADQTVQHVRNLYRTCGATDKARRLVDKCEQRARDIANAMDAAPLRNLMLFLLGMVLEHDRAPAPR